MFMIIFNILLISGGLVCASWLLYLLALEIDNIISKEYYKYKGRK